MRWLLACATALSVASCSVFVNSLGNGYRPPAPPDCSVNLGPPAVDLGYGIFYGLFAIIGFANRTCDQDSLLCDSTKTGEVFTAMAVPLLASSIFGFHNIDRCREARKAYRAALARSRGVATPAPAR